MIKIAIIIAIALAGVGYWQRDTVLDWYDEQAMTPQEQQEAELKESGFIRTDGTVQVDTQFDAELNVLNAEAASLEAQADAELELIEAGE
jgi:hypothetical protein